MITLVCLLIAAACFAGIYLMTRDSLTL